jgi:hypothetical protein
LMSLRPPALAAVSAADDEVAMRRVRRRREVAVIVALAICRRCGEGKGLIFIYSVSLQGREGENRKARNTTLWNGTIRSPILRDQ